MYAGVYIVPYSRIWEGFSKGEGEWKEKKKKGREKGKGKKGRREKREEKRERKKGWGKKKGGKITRREKGWKELGKRKGKRIGQWNAPTRKFNKKSMQGEHPSLQTPATLRNLPPIFFFLMGSFFKPENGGFFKQYTPLNVCEIWCAPDNCSCSYLQLYVELKILCLCEGRGIKNWWRGEGCNETKVQI